MTIDVHRQLWQHKYILWWIWLIDWFLNFSLLTRLSLESNVTSFVCNLTIKYAFERQIKDNTLFSYFSLKCDSQRLVNCGDCTSPASEQYTRNDFDKCFWSLHFWSIICDAVQCRFVVRNAQECENVYARQHVHVSDSHSGLLKKRHIAVQEGDFLSNSRSIHACHS